MVFLILAAQYVSWTLPFLALPCTLIAVFGCRGRAWLRRFDSDVFAQIGLVMRSGSRPTSHPHRRVLPSWSTSAADRSSTRRWQQRDCAFG